MGSSTPSRPSSSSTSSSSSSSSSNLSFSTIFQYSVFAIVLYILIGAPLNSLLGFGTALPQGSYPSNYEAGTTGQAIGQEKLDSLVIPEKDLQCGEEQGFKGVHVLSREPLVVYIEGFLSDKESEHLVKLSEPHFTPSTVWNSGQEALDLRIRHSEKAPLPRDSIVKCIEERARRFQGWRPFTFVEKLWSQRYKTGGHYTYHYDWSTATRSSGRVSSFMVYLEANCTGGGTHFPRLAHPSKRSNASEWCRFIECEDVEEMSGRQEGEDSKETKLLKKGVVFKPIKGNAVYWENMRGDGSGFAESWHAGLPVESGVKIGLNIWSWWQEGLVAPAIPVN